MDLSFEEDRAARIKASANIGRRALIIGMLWDRHVELSDEQRERIGSCNDSEQLRVWFARVVNAETAADVFEVADVLEVRRVELSLTSHDAVQACTDMDRLLKRLNSAVLET